jgi:protein-tyrosine-phosphatase
MQTILIICTANQCRSPFAAAVLTAQIMRAGLDDRWQVESAGIWATPNLPPTDLAQRVAAKRGMAINGRRSQVVDESRVRSSSLIFVMTQNHREALAAEFPFVADRVHLLSEVINQSFDINDPAGGTEEDYEACFHDLQSILQEGFAHLRELMDAYYREDAVA